MDEVTVYQTNDEPMADMAMGLLKAEGIESFKYGAGLRSSLAITVDGLGLIEVRVLEDVAEKAKEILDVRLSEMADNAEEADGDAE